MLGLPGRQEADVVDRRAVGVRPDADPSSCRAAGVSLLTNVTRVPGATVIDRGLAPLAVMVMVVVATGGVVVPPPVLPPPVGDDGVLLLPPQAAAPRASAAARKPRPKSLHIASEEFPRNVEAEIPVVEVGAAAGELAHGACRSRSRN